MNRNCTKNGFENSVVKVGISIVWYRSTCNFIMELSIELFSSGRPVIQSNDINLIFW